MNPQRPYGQGMQRPTNQAGPAIRAGLSVQELKAMTAMRVGHDDPSKPATGPHDYPTGGAYRNPASSYQTATPQQLQAAGITPVVINDRPMVRQKSSTLNSFPVYAASTTYPDQDLVGQNRPYNYDDLRGPTQNRAEAPYVNTSSYAKASSTAYHQNALPVRSGAPQINSVEDVKEMTRLRMLMSERDAFFESSSSGRNQPQGGEPQSNRSGGSDFESGYEERHVAPRFPGHSAGPSVNTSTDSYDSYDFPSAAVDARSPQFRGVAPAGAPLLSVQSLQHQASAPQLAPQQKSLYPSQQQNAYAPVAPQSYGVASGGSAMLHSTSVNGLGIRGTNVLSQQSSQQASPLYAASTTTGSSASGSPTYQQQASSRGLIGSTVRPPVHSTAVVGNGSLGLPTTGSVGLTLTGSSVIGGRRAPAPVAPVTSSLAPLTGHAGTYQQQQQQQYGSQQSSQYSSRESLHGRSDLDASLAREPPRVDRGIERDLMLSAQLTGHSGIGCNIDRLERNLNGHHAPAHSLFDENLMRGQDPNLRTQMLDHSNSMRGPATGPALTSGSIFGPGASSRGGLNGNNGAYQMNSNQRADLSLNSLLSDTSPYQRAGAQVVNPMERTDNLFDLLSSEGINVPRNGAHISNSPFLSGMSGNNNNDLLRSPRELEPLSISQKQLLGSLSGGSTPSPVKEVHSPLQLAPLSPVEVSPTKNKVANPATNAVPRKLSTVGKAATYNTVVTSSKTDTESNSPSTKMGSSARVQAFGDRSESLDGSLLLNGIASPSLDTLDSMHQLSPAQQASSKFPLIKAHTTSRIPTESSATNGVTPKLLRRKSKQPGAPGLDCTPPSSAFDRSLDRSDSSGNMNYLASEMAEMVLDYCPAYELGIDSRDNSNDLTRILAAMSNSSEQVESPSLAFKRTLSNTSIGYTE